MPLFEFKLKALEDVVPWGKESEFNLHWFGLTDGIYFINVGGEQLFQFSREIQRFWKNKYPDFDDQLEYVDYPVVRLYEDVLEILADVMQPVPLALQGYISTHENQKEWESRLWEIFPDTEGEESKEIEDLYFESSLWWDYRFLTSQHLNQGPRIWFWRTENTVHIRWDNEEKNIHGIQPWRAISGEYSLSVEEFVNEVESFHQRLMNDMEQRIELIKTNNPIPQIKIDVPGLIAEHGQRKKTLARAQYDLPRVEDLNAVIQANERLLTLCRTGLG